QRPRPAAEVDDGEVSLGPFRNVGRQNSYSATLVEIIGVFGRFAGYPPLDPPGAELPSAEKNQWLGRCSKRNAHFTGLFFRQLCRGRSPSRPSRRPRPWRGQY